MATISRSSGISEKLSWYFSHCPHDLWDRFSGDDQSRMVEDDLLAGRSVSLVLVSLITAGLLLSAITLAVVLWTS